MPKKCQIRENFSFWNSSTNQTIKYEPAIWWHSDSGYRKVELKEKLSTWRLSDSIKLKRWDSFNYRFTRVCCAHFENLANPIREHSNRHANFKKWMPSEHLSNSTWINQVTLQYLFIFISDERTIQTRSYFCRSDQLINICMWG